ncbi:MAG TPA: sigma-70 family RNA polymerase sigma factor [Anaeromyxobacteraceae bacterium]|nr:sigma-70 family RNA polymerase sigma factor [Anaeromyxobacteraceae bacterium]
MSPVEARIQQLLADGDHRGAATEAIRGFGPKVLGYLRSILRDDEDAADAFGHFAEDLWRGIGGFRGEASFKTWTYKLAWCAAMHVRSDAWKRLGRRLESGEASRLADEVRTKSVVRVEEQRRSLDRLRQTLTAEEQTLLFLRLDQELEWVDVAQVLSAEGTAVEPAALRKRYERLKERLAKLVKEEGLDE